MDQIRGTTIVGVKRNGKTAIAGDGQVTMGESVIMKGNARKVRRLYDGKVVVGFAGSVADAFSLCEMFEQKLNKNSGNLMRSAIEVAQQWRGDQVLRQLNALLIVADSDIMLIVSGTGEVIEPENGVCAIGSGGNYALSAARALVKSTEMSARDIALESLEIASEICVFTNDNIIVEEI